MFESLPVLEIHKRVAVRILPDSCWPAGAPQKAPKYNGTREGTEINIGAILDFLASAVSSLSTWGGQRDGVVPISLESLASLEGPLILVVDGSLTIQKVIELTLIETEFTPVGVDSLDLARSFLDCRDFALTLVDHHSSGTVAYDFCSELKQRDPSMGVVILRGAFETVDPQRFDACGADAVLRKPFDSRDLLATVRRHAQR